MKPSADYVTWLMAPEREGFRRRLNEEWERQGVECGDQCIGLNVTTEGQCGTVHLHRTVDTEDNPIDGWAVSLNRTGRLFWYCKKEKRVWENWQWLPDLGQLLAMIVGETAAGHFYFNMPTQIGEETGMYSTAAFRRDRPPIHYPLRQGERLYDYESVGDEPKIAAASLLAKLWLEEPSA